MKENNDNELEKFVDRLMKDASLESPSPEFTANLMTKVLATEMDKATVYKPLISKKAWFIISGCIIALAGYLIFGTNAQTTGWFESPGLNSVNDGILKSLPDFKFSGITLYSVILLAVLLLVQITFLKNYFNKRFES